MFECGRQKKKKKKKLTRSLLAIQTRSPCVVTVEYFNGTEQSTRQNTVPEQINV